MKDTWVAMEIALKRIVGNKEAINACLLSASKADRIIKLDVVGLDL